MRRTVKTLHLLAGIEFPSENWFSVKLLYCGLAPENSHLSHRALPITPDILFPMHKKLDMEN
jgi:hypothetical protein